MPRTRNIHKSQSPNRNRRSRKHPNTATAFFETTKGLVTLCLLLFAAAFATYIPAMGNPFVVLDDREYVTANPHIRSLGWNTVHWAFTAFDAANWHPLTWLSHALDYKLFALNPAGHHATNILLHAASAVLLFLFLYWTTRRTGPSLFVAALFAVHPLNVESVAWVAERKNVLSTFFFLLVLIAYTWYAQKPNWRRYLLVALLFAVGLMAKPMLVTLPFVLLLLDYWPLERMRIAGTPGGSEASRHQPIWKLAVEKVPLLALSAGGSLLTLKAQHAVVQPLTEYSVGNRIGNALLSYGLYLWKMVWPANLALYPHSPTAPPAWKWLLALAVMVAVTALVVVRHTNKYLVVGWCWFLGTLIPVIGLVQVGEYAMADRYAYISLLGIFVMIAFGLADLAQAKHAQPVWLAVCCGVVLVAFATTTVHQISYWRSDYDLYSHTLELEETSFAHNAVGIALLNPAAALSREDLDRFPSEPARLDEARRHFERALELRKARSGEGSLWDDARSLNNVANLDRMQNRLAEASNHDEAALKIYRQLAIKNPDVYLPYVAVTLNNLGAVKRLQNQLDEARLNYQESLAINRDLAKQNPVKYLPNVAMVLSESGRLEASIGHVETARAQYDEALAISRQLAQQNPEAYMPQLAMTLSNFGLMDAYQQQMKDAQQHLEEALRIERQLAQQNATVYLPNLVMSLSNLGRLELIQGRIAESRAHYTEALKLAQELVQTDRAYTGEVEQIEASLQQLGKMSAQQNQPVASRVSP